MATKYSFSQLESLWKQAGGSATYAAMAAAVATAESGGNPNASNKNSNGTTDRGLWQINSIHGSQSTFDPVSNARAAVSISKNGTNWRPWCTAWSTGKCTGTFLGPGSPALKYLPGGSSTGTAAVGAAAAAALVSVTAATRAIAAAKTQVGLPYKFGAEAPGKDFDCSGLTQWAYKQAGISLPRTAAQQQAATTPITQAQAKPGDLVFYGSPAHHVGIYLGSGKYIEAPHTGAKIKITGVGSDSSVNFGRVANSGAGNTGTQTTPAVFGIPGTPSTGDIISGIEGAFDPTKWFDDFAKPIVMKLLYLAECALGAGLMVFGVWALIRSSDTYKSTENVVTGAVSGTKVRQTSSDKAAAATAQQEADAETKLAASENTSSAGSGTDEVAVRRERARVNRREAVAYGKHSEETQRRRAIR